MTRRGSKNYTETVHIVTTDEACIISTAQQAKPKVSGQNDPALAQAIIDTSFVEIHSSFII